jgi:WD40 repeat protein
VVTTAAVALGLIAHSRDRALALAQHNGELAGRESDAKRAAQTEGENARRHAAEKSLTVDALQAHLYAADLRGAQVAADEGDMAQAQTLLDRHRPQSGEPDPRCFAWWHLHHRCRHSHGTLFDDPQGVRRIAVSADGRYLALVGTWGLLRVRDYRTGALVAESHIEKEPLDLAFLPDGHTLVVASAREVVEGSYEHSGVTFFDATKREAALDPLSPEGKVGRCVALSGDGRLLACGAEGGRIELWALPDRKRVARLSGHVRDVDALAFTPDGKTIVSAAFGEGVRLWDVADPAAARFRHELIRHPTKYSIRNALWRSARSRCQPAAVAVSPDGRTLATAANGPAVQLWDLRSLKQLGAVELHADAVTGLAFSRDGRLLASTGLDRSVRVVDPATRVEVANLGNHADAATGFAVHPDGHLLSGGEDRRVRRWSFPAAAEPPEVLQGTMKRQVLKAALAFSPDGKLLANRVWGAPLRLTRVDTGETTRNLGGVNDDERSMAFSPDGSRLAVGGGDSLSVWNTSSGERVLQVKLPDDAVMVSFSPDGSGIAVGNWFLVTTLYDARTGAVQHSFFGGYPHFSPDGRWLVLHRHTHLIVRDAATYAPVCTVPCPTSVFAISWDGRLIAFLDADNVIVLWDVVGRRTLHRVRGHMANVTALAFCPDGLTLASVGNDARVMLWDVVSGESKAVLRGHTSAIMSIAFSSDGRVLATADETRQVRLWRAPGLPPRQPGASPDPVERAANFRRTERGGAEPEPLGESPEAALERLTRAVEAAPGDTGPIAARAHHLRGLQRWEEAAADFEAALRLGPGNLYWLCDAAECWLMAGNEDAYYRCRAAILASRLDAADVTGWYPTLIVRVCCLRPARPGDDLRPLLAWAAAKSRERPVLWDFRYPEASVLYRMGRFAEADKVLADVPMPTGWHERAIIALWRAMTAHQLGRAPDARRHLAEAVRLIDRARGWVDEHLAMGVAHNVVEHRVLRREAEALIGPLPPESDPGDPVAKPPPLPDPLEVRRWAGHTGTVRDLAVSADGQLEASCGGWPNGDGTLRVWDAETGKELRQLRGHTGHLSAIRFVGRSHQVLAAGFDKVPRLWDADTGELLRTFPASPYVIHALDVTPDGLTAVAGGNNKTFGIWDVPGRRLVKTWVLPSTVAAAHRVLALAVSADGKHVLAGGDPHDLFHIELETGKVLKRFPHGSPVETAVFSPDGRFAVSAGFDGRVVQWDLATAKRVHEFPGHGKNAQDVAFSPDGRLMATAGADATVRLWEFATGRELYRYRAHAEGVWFVRFLPDGRRLLAGGGEKHDFAIRELAIPKEVLDAARP